MAAAPSDWMVTGGVALHRFAAAAPNGAFEAVADVATEDRDGITYVLAQSRPVAAEPGGKVRVGTSFLQIDAEHLSSQCSYLHGHPAGRRSPPCAGILSSAATLPEGVGLHRNQLLAFSTGGGSPAVRQGSHCVLFPTADMPLDEYRARLERLPMLPCDLGRQRGASSGGPRAPVAVTTPWPTDARTCIVTVALSRLAASSGADRADLRLLAWAFCHHVRSEDTAWDDLLADAGVLPVLAEYALRRLSPQLDDVRDMQLLDTVSSALRRKLLGLPPDDDDEHETVPSDR